MIQLRTLTGPRRLARGAALAAGAALPLTILAFLAVGLGVSISLHASPKVKPIVDIAFGLALAGLGVRALRSQPKPKPAQEQSTSVGRAFVVGCLAMATNVTTIALFIPAMKLIAVAGVDDADKAVAGAAVFAITLAVLLLPLAATVFAPQASGKALDGLGSWMQAHQRAINVALSFGFGLYLLVKGVLAL